jgi:ADP-ribose pyrophosphatase YjhB (NUDIX family)
MKGLERFNVRVYGILVDKGRILVSHERYKGKQFSKFPGGGLKLGESVLDCLIREFKEEMDIEVHPSYLFHVTESVQVSKFYPEDQVIALYYIVLCDELDKIKTASDKNSIPEKGEIVEWIELKKFNKSILSFESDREAASKLLDKQPLSGF